MKIDRHLNISRQKNTWRPKAAQRCGMLLTAGLLCGCSADATRRLPTPGAVSANAAACEPGTFIGSMTLSCPQPSK